MLIIRAKGEAFVKNVSNTTKIIHAPNLSKNVIFLGIPSDVRFILLTNSKCAKYIEPCYTDDRIAAFIPLGYTNRNLVQAAKSMD